MNAKGVSSSVSAGNCSVNQNNCEICKYSKTHQPKQRFMATPMYCPVQKFTKLVAVKVSVYHCGENEMLKVKCRLRSSLLITLASNSYIASYYECISFTLHLSANTVSSNLKLCRIENLTWSCFTKNIRFCISHMHILII